MNMKHLAICGVKKQASDENEKVPTFPDERPEYPYKSKKYCDVSHLSLKEYSLACLLWFWKAYKTSSVPDESFKARWTDRNKINDEEKS